MHCFPLMSYLCCGLTTVQAFWASQKQYVHQFYCWKRHPLLSVQPSLLSVVLLFLCVLTQPHLSIQTSSILIIRSLLDAFTVWVNKMIKDIAQLFLVKKSLGQQFERGCPPPLCPVSLGCVLSTHTQEKGSPREDPGIKYKPKSLQRKASMLKKIR